jgi:hypothetical protein
VEPTKDYCAQSDIPIEETFADPTFRTHQVLDLEMVPNTLVIDSAGFIQRVWRGELTVVQWQDVSDYLHVAAAPAPTP